MGDPTQDPITTRIGKGTPLTFGEMDANYIALMDEIAARVAQGAVLQQAITNEETRAKDAENTLTTNLGTERTRATNAEAGLQTQVGTLSGLATTSKVNLVSAINETFNDSNANFTSVSSSLITETSRATTAENGITANLNTEIANRTTADSNLQAQINTEAANRTNADTTLQNQISAITGGNNTSIATIATEIAAIQAADTAEATTRNSADLLIQNALGSEINTRTTNDAAIQTELNRTQTGAGLNTDGSYVALTGTNYLNASTSLADATTKLDTALGNEVTARTTADSNLQTSLNTETQNRINGDSATLTAAETFATNAANTAQANAIAAGVSGNAATATKLQTPRLLSLSGAATGSVLFDGSADASIAVTFTDSGVTAGSYNNLTVNTKGQVTAASNVSYALQSITINGHSLNANVTLTPADVGAIATTQLGVASGVATLDVTGKLTTAQIPDALLGAVVYKGVWDASANNPTITSSVGTKGNYYKVSVSGSTNIDGKTQWNAGDLIIFDGTVWDKVDGLASEVISVNGQVGAVNITTITGNAGTASKLAAAQSIGLSGDVSGSANFDGSAGITIASTLATIADSGTGSFYKFNKNSKGLVTGTVAVAQADITGLLGAASITNTMLANTAVANLSGTNTGDETAATIKSKLGISTLSGSNTGDQTITLTGDVTGSGTGSFAATLATVTQGSTGTSFLKVALDTKGRVTSNAAVGSADITTALGYTPYNSTNPNGYITASGSISGSSGSCTGNAASATNANALLINGGYRSFAWSGQGGQPSWLWGSNDGVNIYVWNPSNFSVNYANSAGSANALATGNNYQMNSLGVGTGPTGTAGEIVATGNITAGYSDERLKNVLGNIPNALAAVCSLNGVIYTGNEVARQHGYDDPNEQVGLLASQVEAVLPQVVKLAPFDMTFINGIEASLSGENYKTVQYEKLVPLLVEAIKELTARVKELESK
jgi:hypothetical protein